MSFIVCQIDTLTMMFSQWFSLNVTAKLETKHAAKGGSEVDVVKDELELSAVQTPSLFGMILYRKYWSIHNWCCFVFKYTEHV